MLNVEVWVLYEAGNIEMGLVTRARNQDKTALGSPFLSISHCVQYILKKNMSLYLC